MLFLVFHQDQSHNFSYLYFFFLPLQLLPEIFILVLSDRKYSTLETRLPLLLFISHHLLSFISGTPGLHSQARVKSGAQIIKEPTQSSPNSHKGCKGINQKNGVLSNSFAAL